jgi:hypothetical protein
MPHPAGSSRRTFQQRRPAINRKLRLTVEDDKHLLAVIVKVVADASTGRYLATVNEAQIRRHLAANYK